MLDFCKCNNFYILNGRKASDKSIGPYTCKDSSTVDYFICSANILPLIIDFYVDDFCPTLSDVHCPVVLNLKARFCKESKNSADDLNEPEKNKIMESK